MTDLIAMVVTAVQDAVDGCIDYETEHAIAVGVLSAVANTPGLAGVLGQALREHQLTTGMSVTSGATCRCGYWSGNEVGGKTRPVGYQGLQWHQAQEQSDAVRTWLRREAT